MINMTLLACPQCLKLYITKIVVRQTIVGGRPTLIFPVSNCTGEMMLAEPGPDGQPTSEPCEFDFTKLQVESFDIPINQAAAQQLVKP